MSVTDETKDGLARERTDLAEDRTLLANERTYAGWLRTGMAAIGIGLGFNALFGEMDPAWIPKAIATSILLTGIFIFIAAERRACAVLGRLQAHEIKTFKLMNLRLITAVMVGTTIALIAAIWVLA